MAIFIHVRDVNYVSGYDMVNDVYIVVNIFSDYNFLSNLSYLDSVLFSSDRDTVFCRLTDDIKDGDHNNFNVRNVINLQDVTEKDLERYNSDVQNVRYAVYDSVINYYELNLIVFCVSDNVVVIGNVSNSFN